MSVVFVAIPTKGTVVKGQITEQVKRDIARLHDKFPNDVFVCPMLQDYQLLPHLESSEASYAKWGNRCEQLLAKCDEVAVLMYEGWSGPLLERDGQMCTSVGVEGEIKYAFDKGINVAFVMPTVLKAVRCVMPNWEQMMIWDERRTDE